MDIKTEHGKLDVVAAMQPVASARTLIGNRKCQRSEAATYRRFPRLVRRCQRFAKVSDATMAQDGSAGGLVHDTFHAGRITGAERSFVLARLGMVPK